MDFFGHLKTPKVINERPDRACPFCLTALHREAFVCAACGAHKWYLDRSYPVSPGDLIFKAVFTIILAIMFVYLDDLINFIEWRVSHSQRTDALWVFKFVIYTFYGFLTLAWLAHIYEFMEAIWTNGGRIHGTVWRRRRW